MTPVIACKQAGATCQTGASRCTVVSALADLARSRSNGHGIYRSGDRLFIRQLLEL